MVLLLWVALGNQKVFDMGLRTLNRTCLKLGLKEDFFSHDALSRVAVCLKENSNRCVFPNRMFNLNADDKLDFKGESFCRIVFFNFPIRT